MLEILKFKPGEAERKKIINTVKELPDGRDSELIEKKKVNINN